MRGLSLYLPFWFLFACGQAPLTHSSGPLVGVQKPASLVETPPKKTAEAIVKVEEATPAAPVEAPTAPAAPVEVQEQGDPEAKDGEMPGVSFAPPEEVPLVGTTFDAKDDLAARLAKWIAATGKAKFQKRIVIEKSKRVITIYADEDPLIRYPVELGFAPSGDKSVEGDGKTPEGELYVCTKNSASKFHRFLGLSYPQPDDAERGIKDGLISAKQRAQIVNAHKAKAQPSWSTPLGGAVGIHGGGKFYDMGATLLGYDWTLGCISTTDEASEAIFTFAEMGTPVTIYP